MIIHRAKDRGLTQEDWLTSHHSFSFNEWYDPTRMGFGALRVINEDFIAPNTGFGMHHHRDMEIVTIVLSGALEHKDSTGGHGIIRAGDVQRMSAGIGVMHSEYNNSPEPVHLLQIWVMPKQRGIPHSYEQESFRITKNELITIVDGTLGHKNGKVLYMHQNAKFSLGEFDAGKNIALNVEKGRGIYLFVISGEIEINGEKLETGDAAGMNVQFMINMRAPTKILLIEVLI